MRRRLRLRYMVFGSNAAAGSGSSSGSSGVALQADYSQTGTDESWVFW